MCNWGTYIEIPVYVWINHPDYPEKFKLKNRPIDACLAPIIYKLNNNGVRTLNCCCGHKQDKRYNSDGIQDKNRRGEILITNESIRHAEAFGYIVKLVTFDWTEIIV